MHEISKGRVGGVFVHDISRLNRNSLHFQYLLARCRDCDVLVFEDGRILNPQDGLDSFIATIRAEVAQLENLDRKKKMGDGRKARVKSGLAVTAPPIGYVVVEKGKWEKHENEDVRRVLSLIFEKAQSLPSIYAVWKYLVEKNIEVPAKASNYFKDHGIIWKQATYGYVTKLLSNPHYTGDYYFRREILNPQSSIHDGSSAVTKPRRRRGRKDEVMIIEDHHEGYISREAFKRLRKLHNQNQLGMYQPVREGKNLLQGIVICGHCGRRMSSRYGPTAYGFRYYLCGSKFKPCEIYERRIRSDQVDAAVEQALLQMVSKPSIDSVMEHYETERQRAFRSVDDFEFRLKQAKTAANKAREDFKAVDPSNYLVKAEMENEWQKRLSALDELKKMATERPEPPPPLTKGQRERLAFLCEKFPLAFKHPSVDAEVRKRLVRCLLEKAVIKLNDDLILVDIYWQGQSNSPTRLRLQTIKYIHRYILEQYNKGLDEKGILDAMKIDGIGIPGQLFTKRYVASCIKERGLKSCRARKRDQIYDAVAKYQATGLGPDQIAERLNADSIKPLACERFSKITVQSILERMKSRTRLGRRRRPKNWDLIHQMLKENLPTNEIVARLNASGCTTTKGLSYTYSRLFKVIRRQGLETPKPDWDTLPPRSQK